MTKKRKGIKRDVIDQVLRGDYTPEYPSKFFIERIGEINKVSPLHFIIHEGEFLTKEGSKKMWKD